MAKNIIIITIIVLTLSIGGGFSYYAFFRVPTFEEALYKSMENSEEVKAFSNSTSIKIEGWESDAEEDIEIEKPTTYNFPFSKFASFLKQAIVEKPPYCDENPEETICKDESAYEFLFLLEGDYDLKEEGSPKIKNELSLKGVSDDFDFSITASSINMANENFYFKLNDFKYNISEDQEGTEKITNFYEEFLVSRIKEKWILFNEEENIENIFQGPNYPSKNEEELEEEFSLTKEEEIKIAKALFKSFDVVSSKNTKIDGSEAYYYKLKVNKEELKKSLVEITTIYIEKLKETKYFSSFEEVDNFNYDEEINKIINENIQYLNILECEIWFSKTNFTFLKFGLNAGIKETSDLFISIESSFLNINGDVLIEEPKESTPFTSIFEEIMNDFSKEAFEASIPDEIDPDVAKEVKINKEVDDTDTDLDGLKDTDELCLGTDKNKKDTDNDGYSDFEEIKNGYNPLKKSPGDKFSDSEKLNAEKCIKK